VFLGDAVVNALKVIAAKAEKLPNYNMDADRGYGWPCWHPTAGTDPTTPPLQVESD
jgi:hypothetical protein